MKFFIKTGAQFKANFMRGKNFERVLFEITGCDSESSPPSQAKTAPASASSTQWCSPTDLSPVSASPTWANCSSPTRPLSQQHTESVLCQKSWTTHIEWCKNSRSRLWRRRTFPFVSEIYSLPNSSRTSVKTSISLLLCSLLSTSPALTTMRRIEGKRLALRVLSGALSGSCGTTRASPKSRRRWV